MKIERTLRVTGFDLEHYKDLGDVRFTVGLRQKPVWEELNEPIQVDGVLVSFPPSIRPEVFEGKDIKITIEIEGL